MGHELGPGVFPISTAKSESFFAASTKSFNADSIDLEIFSGLSGEMTCPFYLLYYLYNKYINKINVITI